MNNVQLEQRLAMLERRLEKHELMRADPRTGLVVTWNNNVPTIYGQAIVQIPVSITGWTSGCGTYAWQEDTFGFSGERVMSGSLFGGSGAYSGSNLMVEMNGNIIASGNFPIHTRAWRRSYTLPSQDVWEFQWQSGGGGGVSGTALNIIDASGLRVSGIQNLTIGRSDLLFSGASPSNTIMPRLATYDLAGMWGGKLDPGIPHVVCGGKEIAGVNGYTGAALILTSVPSIYTASGNQGNGNFQCEGNIDIITAPVFSSGVWSGKIQINAGDGINQIIMSNDYASGGGAGGTITTFGSGGVTINAGSGNLEVGMEISHSIGGYVSGCLYLPGQVVAGTAFYATSIITVGTPSANGHYVAFVGVYCYEGKTGVLGPYGNSIGGGIVGHLGSGQFAVYNPSPASGVGLLGEIAIISGNSIAAYTGNISGGWAVCAGTNLF